MASTYTPLGIEIQATGENAGTWGTKTNTNLQIMNKYLAVIQLKLSLIQETQLFQYQMDQQVQLLHTEL